MTQNLSTNAGDAEDAGSILRLGGSPGEGMATHSSILAWKIPRAEEPGGLQSRESQRVGHHLATELLLLLLSRFSRVRLCATP